MDKCEREIFERLVGKGPRSMPLSRLNRWVLRRAVRQWCQELPPPPRPDGGGGPAGVREPRRPLPPTLSGAAARPTP